MIVASDLFPKVNRLWGNPSVQELSPQSMRDAFERVFSYVQLKLSTVSTSLNAAISNPFILSDITNFEGTVPQNIEASNIFTIQYRTGAGGNDNSWYPLPLGNLENWDHQKDTDEPSGVFYSNGAGVLRLKTNFNPLSFEFRVFYISDAGASGDGQVGVPSFFAPLFEYGMAAEVRINPDENNLALKERIKAETDIFRTKFMVYMHEFEKWARTSRGRKGISKRTPTNAGRRAGRFRYNTFRLGEPR